MVQYEKWFDYPNLVPQFLSVTYTPYLDANQTIAGMIVSLRDITDRKQAEDLLRKSDAHLKTAQRIAALGSWEFDLRTEQIIWSEEVFRIFGRDPEAEPPTFEALQQLIHPDDRDRHQQAVQTAVATIQPYELEFRFYDSDGSLRYVYTRGEPIVDTTGQIIQLVGTVLDITDRKEAEAALRESEHRYATLAAAAPVAIFRFDAAVNCVYVNNRWSEMTGRPAADGLGSKWVEAIHPQDREWISLEVAQWLQTCKAGDLYRNEARILRPDGSILWYFCQMLPETDFSGTITGYIGTLTDITDRKDAEEELRNLSDRLTLAVKSGAIAIWDWNIPEDILTWDDRMYELYGITPNAFTNVYEAWANSVHPDDRPLAEADILKALAGEKDYEHEFRVIHPDGTIHFIKAYALVQCNAQGEPQQLVGINFDITSHKHAEAQLRTLSDRLTLAVKAGAIGIWDWNLKDNSITCNEQMYKLYGSIPDPSINVYEGWVSRLHPDDRSAVEAAVQQALRGEKDYETGFRVVRPDGTVRFVQAYGLVERNEQGEPQQMIGINYDITDIKQAELENQQLKERLQFVLASSPAVIFTCEPEGDYAATFISDNIQDVVGHTPADFLAESGFWANHIHPEDAPHIFAGLATLFAQGHHTHEYRFLHKNGSYRWMWNGLRLVRDAEANVIEIVGYLVDITDRKQAEQALQQLTIDLQRSNQELEQFAYVASHDLQEPLRAITSYTQLLAKRYQGQLDEKADKYIYYVVDGAARMQQLIHDLLAYSRVGRYELKLQPTDCNAILEQVRNDLQVAIAESNAVITVDALPTITADTAQVTQLFQNLVGNALKYRGQAPPIIKISVRQQGKEWAFSIQDNGIGIEPQYAERIFEIFQRLHTRREYDGTGLGLAICKKIVERHHGRIWVESTLGQGAAFCFTLPA
jgi:PAS domain S-box-containing protein